MNSHGTDQAVRATRVRYRVVAMAVLLATITYLDRACIGTLAPDIMRDLHLSKQQMSWVYSAFAIAYAAFEIPTAWWADKSGTRNVLTRIVLWWSGFTMATAAALNFASLIVIRALFGLGEAGAWPSVARTFSRWIPRTERGTVQGIFFAGAHLGGGVTPLVVVMLTRYVNWRAVFAMFGLLGVAWAIGWYRWFRDDPAQHAAANEAEVQRIASERTLESSHAAGWAYWRQLLTNRNTLPLCLMYFPNSFGSYFCMTWLPTYLMEKHGMSAASLGFFAGLPLILSVGGDLAGGVATDALTRRFGLRIGRAGLGAAAYVIAGGAMILATLAQEPKMAASLIAVAVAASMFTLGAAWSTCLDIGGSHAGVVSAAMNTSGQIGSVVSPLLVTYLLKRFGDWNAPLLVLGGLFLIGAACWAVIDPRRKIS